MRIEPKNDKPRRWLTPYSRAWYALIAIVTFVVIDHLSDLLHQLNLRRFMHWQIAQAIRNTLEVVFAIFGVVVAHRGGLKLAVRELGMAAPVVPALTFAAIASAPMLIAFAIGFSINREMTFLSVAVGCFIGPFAEEVIFRGYLFRQLYQRAKMGFWVSALIPSIIFAAGHAYRATHFMELTGILAITSFGSILLCWLYKRWSYNLWVIVSIHCAMNLWWEVFAVDNTALGGWLANGARLATIACAIFLTIFKDRFWPSLPGTADATNAAESISIETKKDSSVRLIPSIA